MISTHTLAATAALGPAAFCSSAAHATTLYADIAAYADFKYSLTTSDLSPSPPVGTGDDPAQTYHFATELLPDQVTYFIHIQVDGSGFLGGLLASFHLSDAGWTFANGSSTLSTNTQGWLMTKVPWSPRRDPMYGTLRRSDRTEMGCSACGRRSPPMLRSYGPLKPTARHQPRRYGLGHRVGRTH